MLECSPVIQPYSVLNEKKGFIVHQRWAKSCGEIHCLEEHLGTGRRIVDRDK